MPGATIRQLADVIALARAATFGDVLGYGAYAGKKDEAHAVWRANMAELATCPNFSVKLGGMLNRGAALNFRQLPAPPNSAADGPRHRQLTRSVPKRTEQLRVTHPVDMEGARSALAAF